jgi:hypothetical protein
MTRFNFKLLNITDLKLVPTQQLPVYVFIKANDVHDTFSNRVSDGFATSITKKEINSEQFN